MKLGQAHMTIIFTAILSIFVGAGSVTALGQDAGQTGSVSASGSGMITLAPQRMRIELVISAKAPSLEEALALLEEKSKAAREQAQKLGAIEDSISMSVVKTGNSDQRAQMARMVQQQLRQGGDKQDEKKDAEAEVVVSLTADWSLSESDTGKKLKQAMDLQKQIKEADLAGHKKESKGSEEEEEEAEESDGGMAALGYVNRMYGGQESAIPGQPNFVFVAIITPDERAKAVREAFTEARDQAVQLTEAAGVQLGSLRSLSSTATGGGDDDDMIRAMRYAGMTMGGSFGNDGEKKDRIEAKSNQFGELKYRVMVMAAFEIKE